MEIIPIEVAPHHPNAVLCYVYTYTNSLTGKVFYVGRGTRERYLQHFKEAIYNTKNPTRVVLAIRAIWQQEGKIIIRKVHRDIPWSEAVDLERELILYYGYNQLVNIPRYKTCQCDIKSVKEIISA